MVDQLANIGGDGGPEEAQPVTLFKSKQAGGGEVDFTSLGAKPVPSATPTRTDVASAAADTAILAANANRLPGSTIANDSTSVLYLLLGAGTASATNFTVAIDGKTSVPGVYFLPDGWTGAVRGFWPVANGSARVTELSA